MGSTTDVNLDADDATEGQAPQQLAPEELAEAKRYGQISLGCDLADRVIDVTFLSVIALACAKPLDTWLSGFAGLAANPSIVRLAVLFVVIYAMHLAVSFPLSFYSGHVVEHRFGLSKQSVGRWLRRYLLRHALGVGFGVLMYAGLFWIIWTFGWAWWIVAAIAFFLVSLLLGQLVPVLIVPLFYKVTRLDDEVLQERMSRLAEGTGLTIEGVYRLDLSAETEKANAMLTGLGGTRRVLMGDTLLDNFSPDEIEVIFAHEIGHHVHRHIPKLLFGGALYATVGLWICDRILVSYAGVTDYGETPVWSLPLLMLCLTLFTMILEPLQNAISRHFERQCDRYALRRTGHVEAYRTAFSRLSRQNKADPDPHPLEVILFHSHPPIRARLALADEVPATSV